MERTARFTILFFFVLGLIPPFILPARASGQPLTFSACAAKNGKLSDLTVGTTPKCKKGETVVSWTQVGPPGGEAPCPPDSGKVGQLCVDTYEASVWSIPATNTGLIEKVKQGTATLDDLIAGGAVQHGYPFAPFNLTDFQAGFPLDGNWTEPLYAVSVQGVLPTTNISWLQAQQACRISGKRLLSNEEWQAAAASTPDPGASDNGATTCVTNSAVGPASTGTRAACVSVWGIHDMVGNIREWVETAWSLVSRDDSPFLPGVLARGSFWYSATFPDQQTGVFAVAGYTTPFFTDWLTGFRCGR